MGRVHDLIGYLRDAKPSLELAAGWAQIWDPEHTRKLEQLDGWMRGVRHKLVLSKRPQEATPVTCCRRWCVSHRDAARSDQNGGARARPVMSFPSAMKCTSSSVFKSQ